MSGRTPVRTDYVYTVICTDGMLGVTTRRTLASAKRALGLPVRKVGQHTWRANDTTVITRTTLAN